MTPKHDSSTIGLLATWVKLKVTLSSPTFKVSLPFLTSMIAPAVCRKGRPKIIGICLSSSMSNTTKSTGIKHLPTLTGTSSRTPRGYFTDLSAICRVMLVTFKSPMFNLVHTDRGMTLTLAPKSHKALSIKRLPILHGIEKLPGSFNLGGDLFCSKALHSSVNATVSTSLNALFLVKMSFMYLAYAGTWVINSVKGTVTCRFFTTSKNLPNCLSSLFFSWRWGKGSLIGGTCISTFFSTLVLASFSLTTFSLSSGKTPLTDTSTSSSIVIGGPSYSYPLRKVTAFTDSLVTGCEGSWPLGLSARAVAICANCLSMILLWAVRASILASFSLRDLCNSNIIFLISTSMGSGCVGWGCGGKPGDPLGCEL